MFLNHWATERVPPMGYTGCEKGGEKTLDAPFLLSFQFFCVHDVTVEWYVYIIYKQTNVPDKKLSYYDT